MGLKLKVSKKKEKINTKMDQNNWTSYNDVVGRTNALAEISHSIREINKHTDSMVQAINNIPETFDASKSELLKCSKSIDSVLINIQHKNNKFKEEIKEDDYFLREYRETLSSIRNSLNKFPKILLDMINIINNKER